MKEIKLLDCTLRDGGYINDWEFGHFNLIRIYERLVSSGVEIIELGFIDARRAFDINRSIFPKAADAIKIFGDVNKKKALTVAMIDYGTCPIENICPANEGILDGLRVIFKKDLSKEAMTYCQQLKDLGYMVFSQAVSITSYTDKELLDLVTLVNDVEPYAMSMVDTYGLLYKENMMHIFEVLNKNLKPSIGLGYHAHNNFQLGFSNVMEILRQKVDREIVVDGTLYGMGKSAGNAPLELIAMNLNEMYEKNYDISQMLEAIDCNLMKIYEKNYWGYNMFYFLAASNRCHPNYVKDLFEKHTLSIKSVNQILDQINEDKKLVYDHSYLESLYYEYQSNECNDEIAKETLCKLFEGKDILIVGPGSSIVKEERKIKEHIESNDYIKISINFIPKDIDVDYVFITNPRRYNRMIKGISKSRLETIKTIATSNVTSSYHTFDYVMNNESLLDKDYDIMDNSLVMLLKLLKRIKINHIICVGLDGYIIDANNYVDSEMEYWFSKDKKSHINTYVRNYINIYKKDVEIKFLTKSLYDEVS